MGWWRSSEAPSVDNRKIKWYRQTLVEKSTSFVLEFFLFGKWKRVKERVIMTAFKVLQWSFWT